MNWIDGLNGFVWIASNIMVAYISMLLVVFVIGYFILFDPKATTAGKYIFRFFLSLFFLIGLSFINFFVYPDSSHKIAPDLHGVLSWKLLVRFVAYAYVAFTVTGLSILLIVRKWWPMHLRTSLDYEIIKPRKTE